MSVSTMRTANLVNLSAVRSNALGLDEATVEAFHAEHLASSVLFRDRSRAAWKLDQIAKEHLSESWAPHLKSTISLPGSPESIEDELADERADIVPHYSPPPNTPVADTRAARLAAWKAKLERDPKRFKPSAQVNWTAAKSYKEHDLSGYDADISSLFDYDDTPESSDNGDGTPVIPVPWAFAMPGTPKDMSTVSGFNTPINVPVELPLEAEDDEAKDDEDKSDVLVCEAVESPIELGVETDLADSAELKVTELDSSDGAPIKSTEQLVYEAARDAAREAAIKADGIDPNARLDGTPLTPTKRKWGTPELGAQGLTTHLPVDGLTLHVKLRKVSLEDGAGEEVTQDAVVAESAPAQDSLPFSPALSTPTDAAEGKLAAVVSTMVEA